GLQRQSLSPDLSSKALQGIATGQFCAAGAARLQAAWTVKGRRFRYASGASQRHGRIGQIVQIPGLRAGDRLVHPPPEGVIGEAGRRASRERRQLIAHVTSADANSSNDELDPTQLDQCPKDWPEKRERHSDQEP
ncbi:MAG: hypothetical protein ABSD51_05845, partial [Candidatus Binatus sp.]